jgi:hypothetical protein
MNKEKPEPAFTAPSHIHTSHLARQVLHACGEILRNFSEADQSVKELRMRDSTRELLIPKPEYIPAEETDR